MDLKSRIARTTVQLSERKVYQPDSWQLLYIPDLMFTYIFKGRGKRIQGPRRQMVGHIVKIITMRVPCYCISWYYGRVGSKSMKNTELNSSKVGNILYGKCNVLFIYIKPLYQYIALFLGSRILRLYSELHNTSRSKH